MNWTASARAAGVTRQAAQKAYEMNAEFHAAVDAAKQAAIDNLELVAVQRASSGASDRMLAFMLKAHMPETYDPPQRHQLTGPDGGPISIDIAGTIDAQLSRLAARVESSAGGDPAPAPGEAPGADPEDDAS
jgi:hypothetical protein